MAKYNKGNSDFKYEVKQHIGVLSHGTKSWSKQANFVSWNGNATVLDIRDWDYAQTKSGKGLTLNRDEACRLRDLLNSLNLGEVEALPYPEAPDTVGDSLMESGFDM